MSSSPSSTTKHQAEVQLRDAQIRTQNKNITAFWLMLLTQILYSIMYGLFIKVEPSSTQITNQTEFIQTALIFIMIVVGFGLIFGIYARLGWSALGFNLLIAALSIQTYFLINAFWTKAQIYYQGNTFDQQSHKIFLTSTDQFSSGNQYSATFTEALKCSLSCIIAFSFVLGRVGPLQVYFISIFGTILYELTRQICLIRSGYEPGALKIFLFGSSVGLMFSLFLKIKEYPIKNNINLIKTQKSINFALLGVLIYWVIFPLLVFDSKTGFVGPQLNSQIIYEPSVLSIILSISASTVIGIIFSFINHGFQNIVTSSLAGGIIILTCSTYISNPVFAVVTGVFAGLFQQLFIYIQKKTLKKSLGLFSKFSLVFFVQSIMGLCFAAWNRQIVISDSDNLSFNWSQNVISSALYFGNGWIFAATGMALGIILGIIFTFLTYHEEKDHFTDRTYWIKQDMINVIQEQDSEMSFQFIEKSGRGVKYAYL